MGADLRALDRQSVLSGSGSNGGIFDSYRPENDNNKGPGEISKPRLGLLNNGLPAARVEHVPVFQKWNNAAGLI